jgi:hypothetical protein
LDADITALAAERVVRELITGIALAKARLRQSAGVDPASIG